MKPFQVGVHCMICRNHYGNFGFKRKKKKMTDKELIDYIRNRKYNCCLCAELQKQVLDKGLIAIDEYDGMICGGVEDMFIKRGRW
jgi:hypothetical protein